MRRSPEERKSFRQALLANQNGAVLILVAILAVVLVGITALAIVIGHLPVTRNELRNAADAGALAGAQAHYEDPDGAGGLLPGEGVNAGANQVAFDAAVLNLSEKIAVGVNSPLTNAATSREGTGVSPPAHPPGAIRWRRSTSSPSARRIRTRWTAPSSFVNHFGLLNADGKCAPLEMKFMYFMPDGTPHEPTGNTGGPNFGVLAKRPALVD